MPKLPSVLQDALSRMNEISIFLLKFGTLRSNKAMHYQAACFGVYFHAWGSKGASPGLPHLLIGDSFPGRGLETKRELKQNAAIRSMSLCFAHCTIIPSNPSTDRPPRQQKTCHEAYSSDSREFSWSSVIHKTLSLSLHRGSLWCLHQVFHSIPAIHKVRDDFYHPIIAQSTTFKALGVPCLQWFWAPNEVLGSELDMTVD